MWGHMLVQEARWFQQQIEEIEPDRLFPMLNVGSSTGEFRSTTQPWIDQYIFRPITDNGHRVIHMDLQDAPGVDIVGDLTLPETTGRVVGLGVKSVLCSNLLEHVLDRQRVCDAINSVLPRGGYIFVSCPHRYPRHDDPVDTMFRPDVGELAAPFNGAEIIAGEILVDGTYYDLLNRSPVRVVRSVGRLSLPFYRPRGWLATLRHLTWLTRHFEQTCLVLQKG